MQRIIQNITSEYVTVIVFGIALRLVENLLNELSLNGIIWLMEMFHLAIVRGVSL